MSTVLLICGLPGAGKTTLAKRIERERPALRLTEDEWVAGLFGDGDVHDDAMREAIKEVQWETAVRALRLGVDVVLDWGLWALSERDDFRARAAALGVRAELVFLDVPLAELSRRLAARNAALPPATYRVTDADLSAYARVFEPPTPEEVAAFSVVSGSRVAGIGNLP